MIVRLMTDSNINGTEALAQQVEDTVRGTLGHLSEHLTRVEVHLSDTNSGAKSGPADFKCLVEARPASHQPVVATDQAATVSLAVDGASEKLKRSLDSLFGRLAVH